MTWRVQPSTTDLTDFIDEIYLLWAELNKTLMDGDKC
jgi:hypothetical protein